MIEASSKNLLQSSSSSQTAKIKSWLAEKQSAFAAAKSAIEVSGYDQATLQKVLDKYYGFDSDFQNGLYIATADGQYMKATDSTKTEKDPLNSEWYKHGITTINMSITDPYEDSDGNKIVSASGILNDGSGQIKVIGADLSLNSITTIVNSSVSMDGAAAFLINNNDDVILAHRDSSLVGTTLDASNSDPFLAGVAQKITARDYTSTTIDGNMVDFSKVGETGWILVSYIPKSIIYADINQLRNMLIIIGLIAIVLLTIIVERVINFVIKPVSGLTKNITDMAQGDFTIQINSRGNDEIAMMGRSLEEFSKSMCIMIADIRNSADNLKAQSDTSSSVSNEMYQSAKVQAESMEQLNSTVDQLSASVNDIAESATTLANVVSETREKGNDAGNKMTETVDASVKAKSEMQNVSLAMDQILESMKQLETAINKVGSASEEITSIVQLIGDIAEETNLLSLNASIEAARAGEAGKGFAVVASEIGKLATNSTESVNNITNLINEIHTLVGDAVSQASESSKNVTSSSSSIKDAVAMFDSIYSNIQDTSSLITTVMNKIEDVDSVATNVAAISEEQAASSEEILSTSETMVEQANSITANSEHVADDSVELAKTAQSLSDHMEKFRIDNGKEA
jgi:methyl-accepting chemotaxis protein